MVGLIDGSLSTLAPIFAVVLASHDTRFAFIAGLATSIGAAISMGFSEALSDTGELTGRGSPWSRGLITGGGTFLGGILHSLPFLITDYKVALFFAVAVVAFELLALACRSPIEEERAMTRPRDRVRQRHVFIQIQDFGRVDE